MALVNAFGALALETTLQQVLAAAQDNNVTLTQASLDAINAILRGEVLPVNLPQAQINEITAAINAIQSNALTDAELRATPVPVSGDLSVTMPDDYPLPAGQVTTLTPQTDALTDAELRATPVPVSTGLSPLTDAQLRSAPVPVDTGLSTQTDALTDAELRATPVPVSTGQQQPLTDTELRATPVPVSGTVDVTMPDEYPLPAAQVNTLTPQGDALTDAELRASPVSVGGTIGVSNTDFPDAVQQQYQQNRYGGGKQSYAGALSSSGNHTVITPPAGQRVRVYWVHCVPNPQNSTSPLITVSIGATPIYVAYAVSHWEIFEGDVDESVVINLSTNNQIAATIHYEVIE